MDTITEAVAEQLYEVVNTMLKPYGKRIDATINRGSSPATPFDVSPPVPHKSRAAFNAEKAHVDRIVKATELLISAMSKSENPEAAEKHRRVDHLEAVINEKMLENFRTRKFARSRGLAVSNVVLSGGFGATKSVLLCFQHSIRQHHIELEAQGKKYWSDRNRSANHFARAIAFRLARLFAQQTGEKPTYGTSGQTGLPSTNYTVALQTIFEILGVESQIATAAKWAVNELTEEDYRKPLSEREKESSESCPVSRSVLKVLHPEYDEDALY